MSESGEPRRTGNSEMNESSLNYTCMPLAQACARDVEDILSFEPVNESGHNLVMYLQAFAVADERAGRMRTYLVRDQSTGELAGYFALKAGLVSYNEIEEGGISSFDTEPGVELANFAINNVYRSRHPEAAGCGKLVFQKLIIPTIIKAAQHVGVSLVYLYALPEDKVIDRYQSYGFERLDPRMEQYVHARIKPRYDAGCIFMMMRLWNEVDEEINRISM